VISLSTVRIAMVALALVIGSYAFASTLAEIDSLDRPTFPSDPAKISSRWAGEMAGWVEAVSPLRSDLEANHALIAALQVIQSGKEKPTTAESANKARAQARIKQTLSIAPFNSELWLALALLQAQQDPRDPTLVEALKMAYFTAPNDAQLMPVRLDTATLYDALTYPDVKELARGDVRLMLTRQPELKAAVVSAYRRASSLGKAFLEEAVRSIDPSFLPTLRG
jgi:hypothetical protein